MKNSQQTESYDKLPRMLLSGGRAGLKQRLVNMLITSVLKQRCFNQ